MEDMVMTYKTPDVFLVALDQIDSFIKESRKSFKQFQSSKELRYCTQTVIDWEKANPWLEGRYKEGRILGLLNITFQEFVVMIENDRWKNSRYRRDWSVANCPYRDGNSYRKNTDHEKKEFSQPWREYKKFNKDKSKHKGWHSRPKAGISYWKEESARSHRAWVKDRLRNEDWDAFHDQEYDIFIDPWCYD
jgi:hypothetical protein